VKQDCKDGTISSKKQGFRPKKFVNRRKHRGASRGRKLVTPCFSKVPDNVVKSAFATADAIGTQCIGFDYVVDSQTGEGKIIEMCFGFDFDAIKECGGYWDRNLTWHDEELDVMRDIIENLMKELYQEEYK
jgi:hypothetical protein